MAATAVRTTTSRTTTRTKAPATKPKPVRSVPPTIIKNPHDGAEYIRKEMLGKGGFADCFLIVDRNTGQELAAKVVEKAHLRARTQEKLQSEVAIHRSLHHPGVVRLDSVFEDSKFVYILLEVCPNKTLLELVRGRTSLPEAEVRYWMYHIVEAIAFIHSQSVIHRDLKLGNILIDADHRPKLADFGLATRLDTPDERKKTMCGTPNYIAPEIISDVGKNGHSYEVDVWSLGVIFYMMLFGRAPFESRCVDDTYSLIKSGTYSLPKTSKASKLAETLIKSMLNVDPLERPTIAELRKHQYFLSMSTVSLSSLAYPSMSSSSSSSLTLSAATTATIQPPLLPATVARKALAPLAPLTQTTTNQQTSTTVSRKPVALAPTTTTAMGEHQEPVHLRLPPATTTSESGGATTTSESGGATTDDEAEDGCQNYFVANWREFAKYGFAFQLGTGAVGALFNDATRMVSSACGRFAEYTEPVVMATNGQTSFKTVIFGLEDAPAALNKKVKLLCYFIESFPSISGTSTPTSRAAATTTSRAPRSFPSVRRWKRDKNGIAFRLSHNLAQFNFADHTKLYIDLTMQTCSYMDTNRDITQYAIAALCPKSQPSVHKRFRYAKQVFSEF